jgi:hypothetical protein
VARSTVVAARGDALSLLDVRTGDIVGAIPGVAAVRTVVDASLAIAVMDADGMTSGHRLATHLSVI